MVILLISYQKQIFLMEFFYYYGKSTQQTGRLVLPTNWLRLLGISESFRKVEVTYEDGSITIKKGYKLPYLLANQGHVIAATVTNNAKNFLKLGIDIETISKGTGLTIEEIKNIELEE